ncbi:hypothetical protein [Actinomyces procaprae]|uniref:hypothetical protein n=1 Tax=Actinomyces procaprae TaxID=2560010 RepID=UPI00109E1363|nr:hypothetical protein [Actinomyces procaprae]
MSDSQQQPLVGVTGIWDNQQVATGTYTEKAVFTFRGEAVEDGTMDAAQFGQALLGYSRMVGQAARIVSPKAGAAEVKVVANRQGSFETLVSIGVTLSSVEAVRDWILGTNGQTLEQALSIAVGSGAVLGTVVGGAVKVSKWLRGRHIARREKTDATHDRIVTDGGDSMIALAKSVDVMLDPLFRRGVRDFSQPTTMPGIDDVILQHPDGEEAITMADRNFFLDDLEEEDLVEEETMRLRVERLAFDGAPWRFSHKPSGRALRFSFSAPIDDQEFLDDVAARRVVFGDGDEIDALVQISTPAKPRPGARRQFRITRVVQVHYRDISEQDQLLTEDGLALNDDVLPPKQ